VRDAIITFISAAAVAAGLIGLVGWPWTISVPACIFLASIALLIDTCFFGRPIPISDPRGRRLAVVLGGSALVFALMTMFFVGRSSSGWFLPVKYQFIVTNADGTVTIIKSVPYEGAQSGHLVTTGDSLGVDCWTKDSSGTVWYRLSDKLGWLTAKEVGQAPHTGEGSPPRCPN
jgi:hypothetical protein